MAPQLSVAVTEVGNAGISSAHSTVSPAGTPLITGAIVSLTNIRWVQKDSLLQWSIAWNTLKRVYLLRQVESPIESDQKKTYGAISQVSFTIAVDGLNNGTESIHETVVSFGHMIVGGVVSCTIIC